MTELNDYYQEECQKMGMEIRELSDDELAAFQTVMEEKVHPQAIEQMGQERWDALMEYIDKAQ